MTEFSNPGLDLDDSLERAGGAIRLLLDLLQIEGQSRSEGKVAGFLRNYLTEVGIPEGDCCDDGAHERIGAGECGNLIVSLPGTGDLTSAPRLLYSAHMDVVPLCAGTRVQLDPARRVVHSDGRTALGADNRSGCAAIAYVAARLLREAKHRRPLTLAFFVQEEIGLRGSRVVDAALLRSPQFAVNVDGGAPERVFVGGIGAADWKVTVRGVPAHAAVHPEDGVSAVAVTALALAALHRDGWHGRIEKFGQTGTANVGAIRGGNASNVVTDIVEVTGEARSHDDAFLDHILTAIQDAFALACGEVANSAGRRAGMDFHSSRRYSAFEIGEDSEPACAVGAALSNQPRYEVSDGGVDANNLNVMHGIPAVTIGAGAHRLHTVNEYCNLDEFVRSCDLLYRLATTNP